MKGSLAAICVVASLALSVACSDDENTNEPEPTSARVPGLSICVQTKSGATKQELETVNAVLQGIHQDLLAIPGEKAAMLEGAHAVAGCPIDERIYASTSNKGDNGGIFLWGESPATGHQVLLYVGDPYAPTDGSSAVGAGEFRCSGDQCGPVSGALFVPSFVASILRAGIVRSLGLVALGGLSLTPPSGG